MAEHLGHVEVEGPHAVGLLEGKVGIARGLAHDVERRALALGNGAHVVEVLLLYEQPHALLALVGYYLLGRERGVADGQLRHVDEAAAVLHQLRQAVDMSGRAMVVDADDGVHILLTQRAHEVVGALLHLGVGALHGVEFYAAAVAPRIDGAHGTAAEAYAVVVAAHDHNLVALGGCAFEAVAARAVAHASGQHDDLVVAILLAVLLVLEGEHRAGDERLPELVAEVRGPVAGLDEDLLGRLVEPWARLHSMLVGCRCILVSRIRGHIHRRAGDGPRAHAAAHAVAYLASGACAGAVEGFHGRWEVVCLGLDADDALYLLDAEEVARGVVGGCKLLHDGSGGKCHIVLVGRYDVVGVLLRGAFDHGEEA